MASQTGCGIVATWRGCPTAHRMVCARRLAEAGCTLHQIKSITGHRTDAEVRLYTAKADPVRLAHNAFEKLQDTTDNPKPL